MSSPYDNLGDVPPQPQAEKKRMAKPIAKSKTFWVNLIAGAGAVLTWLVGSDLIADNPEYIAYGTTALAVVNLILRLVTKEPVKLA